MPTDNPKISAYVPQSVYDAVKQFQEEHNLSMSQAATAIFADYLGVEEVKSGEVKLGGITLDRFEQLEKNVAELNQLKEQVSQLQDQVEQLQSTSNLLSQQSSVEQVIDIDQAKSSFEQEDIASSSPSSDDQLLNQSNSEPQESSSEPHFNLLGKPLLTQDITPISGRTLSSVRFGLGKDTVSGAKKKKIPEQFIQWTRERDPDGIGWKHTPKGYIPSDELPSELKGKLLQWIEENIQ